MTIAKDRMETIRPFLNVVDISVFVVLILGILGGLRRGLSGELLRMITVVIAVLVGWKGAFRGAEWLSARSDWPNEDLVPVAFFGLIISSYLLLSIVRHTFRLFLDFTFKGKLERLGGAAIGIIRATLFICATLLAASLLPSEPVQQALQASVSGRLAATHIVPLYGEWTKDNPRFKLPELEQIKEISVETPPWENYLGPLIEDTSEEVEKQQQP